MSVTSLVFETNAYAIPPPRPNLLLIMDIFTTMDVISKLLVGKSNENLYFDQFYSTMSWF